jgi:stage II sporulation protein AB (anti-sigma F factor)
LEGKGSVAIAFSANLRYVRPVRHFISALCILAEYDEDETESIALVATELLNNAIEHGARSPDEEIELTMRVTADMFTFVVVDPGRGGEKFARTRGRGLFLIKNYMDELEISYDPARGTRLAVSKAMEA